MSNELAALKERELLAFLRTNCATLLKEPVLDKDRLRVLQVSPEFQTFSSLLATLLADYSTQFKGD